MPDLSLSFNQPHIVDDVSFHPCVRYNRWEQNKVVSFVPPDGQFKLMSYRFEVFFFKKDLLLDKDLYFYLELKDNYNFQFMLNPKLVLWEHQEKLQLW